MLRTLCIELLIVLGVVGIAGGIWGLSLRAESDVPAELLGAAQTVLDYADKAFDGAHDFDLTLRLCEKAECVYHIPKVLYYWRGHAGSTANDMSAKM